MLICGYNIKYHFNNPSMKKANKWITVNSQSKNISFVFDQFSQFTLEWLSSTVRPRSPERRQTLLTMCSPYKETGGCGIGCGIGGSALYWIVVLKWPTENREAFQIWKRESRTGHLNKKNVLEGWKKREKVKERSKSGLRVEKWVIRN